MRLYLAGPMTGHLEFNRTAFDDATLILRADDHEVFSPVEYATAVGFDFTGTTGNPAEATAQGFDLREALAVELAWICRYAQAVILLPCWQQSTGAAAELAAGHALGLPAWEFTGFRIHDTNAAQITRGAA